jgi:hypothetical protein
MTTTVSPVSVVCTCDFEEFAGLFAQIVHAGDDKPRGHSMEPVKAFRARFRQLQYSL